MIEALEKKAESIKNCKAIVDKSMIEQFNVEGKQYNVVLDNYIIGKSSRISPEAPVPIIIPEKKYSVPGGAGNVASNLCALGATVSCIGVIGNDQWGTTLIDILDNEKGFLRYFPHGVIHHIGLDVHDPGNYSFLDFNMIVTVEPGIYIPEGSPCDPKWWSIGIRLEDDILITRDGNENLSEFAPRKWNEVEMMMKRMSPLDQFNLPRIDD